MEPFKAPLRAPMVDAINPALPIILRGSWAKWGYPNYNLLITLLTKSHEPLSKEYAIIPIVWGH